MMIGMTIYLMNRKNFNKDFSINDSKIEYTFNNLFV